MRITPISYSAFHIRDNKKKAEILSPAEPVISDVPNFYIPTVINFRGQKDSGKELEEKFKNSTEEELKKLLKDTNLSSREKEILERRYSGDELVSYSELGDYYDVSGTSIVKKLKGALLKIQISNNSLDEETKEYIEDFSKTFNLSVSDAQNILSRDIKIMDRTPKERKENIENLVKRFEDEGLTVKAYLQACAKQPQLFTLSPDTIENNVRNLVKKFENEGLTVKSYLPVCLKQSQLFYQSPDTIEKNARDVVKKFEDEGLTVEVYLQACAKQPQLFTLSPDTIENNVRGLVKKFEDEGLTVKSYLPACLKRPSLFYQSPDTIENNVRNLVKKFENEGLTVKSYLPACLKQPQLFCRFPDTIENNVRDLVKRFENEGLTVKSYLPACLKQPPLFYQSPDTMEQKVRNLVKKFENEGLTVKNYLPACLKRPQLFYQSPDTIENNIRDLVKKFEDEGLTVKTYLPACLKQPPLFYQMPNTIGEHIDILKFSKMNTKDNIKENNFFDKILSRPVDLSCSSSLLLIKYLIIPKMFEGEKIPKELRGGGIREKLNDYLKSHPEASFTLNIKPIKTNTDCFKILNETIKLIEENVGRDNIFEIKVQE